MKCFSHQNGQFVQIEDARIYYEGIASLPVMGISDGGVVGYRLTATGALHIEKLVAIGASWHWEDVLPMKDRFLFNFEMFQ